MESGGCPFYRVPEHSSFIAQNAGIGRDISRRLPRSETRKERRIVQQVTHFKPRVQHWIAPF